ncbi:uncharacterized protein MKK02DRAFT_39533 [Dioszegia hungarica]|uniref:Mediator of RNA polymerase II transcription subunit 10 n=1 Tax=Dioszegia hungarica TaxID=4972 RepID=A0AA38LXZ8_9TREE|nr:uncharacterized protein MKK02DRAFT_39533 [Dioszegia hungarica]KAI9639238.1 hypothetical protein MKK02DRAFT_39533 [Dioszegia hungarica]
MPPVDTEAEQAAIRQEVEQHLLRLSQDLYEMEICAGDVGQGMEGAVPAYMAKINLSLKVLSDLSGRMTEGVPRQVVEKIDTYSNPHSYTKTTLTRATGENQYALGRMLGLESFRSQLQDALSADFPQIPLPDRRHTPLHALGHVNGMINGGQGEQTSEQVVGVNGNMKEAPAHPNGVSSSS